MSALCDEVFEAILMARQRVYAVADPTPLEELVGSNLPFRLFVKREDLGPIKAYKWRGAYNRMALLSDEERARGIVAASAGNHAQGVALAAKLLSVHAKIFMPRSTPDVKQAAVKRFGGDFVEIVLHGDSYDMAGEAAKLAAKEEGLTFIHPYDDVAVMGGQGTLADEVVMSGKGPFDVAFLQVGGGGLASAAAVWLKRQYPGIKIYGVEGVQQASMKAALEAGTPTDIGRVDIFCDGTAVRKAGTLTFEVCKEVLDGVVTVTNEDICWAIQKLWETNRIIPETSGAMGVAAALKSADWLAGKKVLTVISGANVDFGQLGVITRNSQVNGAKRRYLRVHIPERPGAFLDVFGKVFSKSSITEFQYGKTSETVARPVIGVAVSDEQWSAITGTLDATGVPWEDVTGDADTLFRVIPFDRNLLHNPLFVRIDFYERPGALQDFLLRDLGVTDNICYFNYLYTGERVGRALIGVEFAGNQERDAFCERLKRELAGAVRSSEIIRGKVAERLWGSDNT